MKRSRWFALALLVSLTAGTRSYGQILVNGIPNIDDDRLHAWYDGNEALGRDGIAETPLWPNRQGNPDHAIGNSFGGAISIVDSLNGHKALRFEDAVSWQNVDLWGILDEGFTVFFAATVLDPSKAFFFTGNQGGGGSEVNANFETDTIDTWTMEGGFDRVATAPVVADEFQLHAFTFTDGGFGRHHINGDLVGEGEIGLGSIEGFVLGGRQNGNQRASVDFAEVLVFNDDLADADRNQIFSYLNGRYFGSAGVAGDFDGDGALTATDIDQLSAAVRAQTNEAKFDLTADNVVNDADRNFWVESLKKTYYGDSNLNGEFNSEDFVVVFQTGEYEDAIADNSTWADGDWNGDQDFDSSDFVTAFQAGGYEAGPRAAVAAVPEPQSIAWLLLGLLPMLRRRQ